MTYKMPSMEHRFAVQLTGEESGVVFTGDFLYKRPTNTERVLIEQMRARLCADLLNIDQDVYDFSVAASHLKFTLKESPDWWKDSDYGGNLYDRNVVMDIFAKVKEFENGFKKKLTSGNPQDVKAPDGQK